MPIRMPTDPPSRSGASRPSDRQMVVCRETGDDNHDESGVYRVPDRVSESTTSAVISSGSTYMRPPFSGAP